MNQAHVLIVEDEPIPAAYLQSLIEANSFFHVVSVVTNADDALALLANASIDVVCLDIMLEGSQDGARLSLDIRQRFPQVQILFLTAYSEEEMLEYASESKAFAYLLKPYRPDEIKATFKLLETQLKRTPLSTDKPDNIIDLLPPYRFDLTSGILYQGDQEITLGKKEAELLSLLCRNPHITLSKETILKTLHISDLSLRSSIYRIRKATAKHLILSIKKYGYKVATATY